MPECKLDSSVSAEGEGEYNARTHTGGTFLKRTNSSLIEKIHSESSCKVEAAHKGGLGIRPLVCVRVGILIRRQIPKMPDVTQYPKLNID